MGSIFGLITFCKAINTYDTNRNSQSADKTASSLQGQRDVVTPDDQFRVLEISIPLGCLQVVAHRYADHDLSDSKIVDIGEG